jgi:hypothetical protein
MGLTDRIVSLFGPKRDMTTTPITFSDYFEMFNFAGNSYLTGMSNLQQTIRGKEENIDNSYGSLVWQAYKENGVVFACMLARQQVFSQVGFKFQNRATGDLFGKPSLDILDHPWPNGQTPDLLARAIQDVDLGGNFYCARRGDTLERLRPDWVTIVIGSMSDRTVEAGDSNAEVLGYIYHPGGRGVGREPEAFLRSEVAHWAPIPDPTGAFRGMSWLYPVVREIVADKSMTAHRNLFFENGATPNMIIQVDKDLKEAATPAAFLEWVAAFKKAAPEPRGWDAFKTMYLAGGTTANVVGRDMQQIDFANIQGAGEVRICIASGVPAPIVGVSEGLQGSALNEGNYNAAKRKFIDFTIRSLWQGFANAMETIVPAPGGSRLWYDDRNIPALAEDKKDTADVLFIRAQAVRHLLDGGYKADDVIKAIEANDLSLLVGKHTGLFSVQLQAPGSTKMPAGEVPGESPVGLGTKPETIPAGDTSTKPLAAVGAGKNGSKP